MTTHFAICILAGESPLQGLPVDVPMALPSGYLADQGWLVGDASSQTLPSQNSNLDFGHVQPTGVFRGVMKFHAAQQPSCRPSSEDVDEALAETGVEIVQDQMNAPRSAVDALDQVLGEGHEVGLAAKFRGDVNSTIHFWSRWSILPKCHQKQNVREDVVGFDFGTQQQAKAAANEPAATGYGKVGGKPSY